MYDRSDKLKELFKMESYETIIEDPRKTKSILMDLGVSNKDISLIIGIISTNQIRLRTQLFETKNPNISAEISRDSYFSAEAIKDLLTDIILAASSNNSKSTKSLDLESKNDTKSNPGMKTSILTNTNNSEVPDIHMDKYILATKGDLISQLFVAQSYDFGINEFPKNPECAFRWYLKTAISTENPDLYFMIGQCYQTGYGTIKSSKNSIKWVQSCNEKQLRGCNNPYR